MKYERGVSVDDVRRLFSLNADHGTLVWNERPATDFPSESVALMWNKQRAGRVAGCRSTEGYLVCTINGKQFKAHRVVWAHVYGVWPSKCIDHVNGNPSDNRPANLRDVAVKANNQNRRRANSDSASGVLGVFWDKYRHRWKAQLNVNGRMKNCGRFKTQEEAHAAYVEAKRKLHEGCTL